jgi:hypothetical protein
MLLAVALCAAAYLTVCVGIAAAERPARPTEFAAINHYFAATERTLHVKLRWVHVSTRGPYALAYLAGKGQISANVMRGAGTHWSGLGAISDEGLRCGLVPLAIVAELNLERYNEGPKPCSST